MSQVQVDVADVHTAAAGAAEAAHLVASTTDQEDLTGLAQALPGSMSAGAATDLAARWQEVTNRWHRAAQVYSEALQASAGEYTRTDQDSAHAQHRLARRLGAPVPQ